MEIFVPCPAHQSDEYGPPSELTPSWIRAPPESLMPMTGMPVWMALSMILQIFSACVSDRLPPKTVKSCHMKWRENVRTGKDLGAA